MNLDTILAVSVIALPTGLAVMIEIVSPDVRRHPFWRIGVVAIGIAISGLALWQQYRMTINADKDRKQAIQETSQRVAQEVTEFVKRQYDAVVRQQKDDNDALRRQLSAQGKDVQAIRGSNIVTGKAPVRVELANPIGGIATSVPIPSPGISWTQEPTPKSAQWNHPGVMVKLTLDQSLDLPAFLLICDRACKVEMAGGSGISQIKGLLASGEPNVTGVVFNIPRPWPSGEQCAIHVESKDDQPIRVMRVRTLQPSEVPLSAR